MAQFSVSVIIPIRERRQELAACLSALEQQTYPHSDYEILICDDGSVEDLSETLAGFNTTLNIVHLKQQAKGPAAARNLGIRAARAPIVAMTDSDTIPHPDWLNQIMTAFAKEPAVLGVEGKVTSEKPDEFGALGEGPTNLTGGVYLTCNCAYRRDVLLKVGGFDESFPYAAYEDVEIAARVCRLGKIAWQPSAVVWHPRRVIKPSTVLKKLEHWEYVLVVGIRYGYLGWPRYPVKFPVVRVLILSIFVLPLSKFREAAKNAFAAPSIAIELCKLGALESLGAIFQVAPKVLFGEYKKKIGRKDYLAGHA